MVPVRLICAPSNLGLRPLRPGHVPGTWRAPQALTAAGLKDVLAPLSAVDLPAPLYSPEPQPGTRLRNGPELRRFNLALANAVDSAIGNGEFAFVAGGDCSVLLGALAGARRHGNLSLVHIDGHSDFRHPGNAEATLGAVAGMDLALATGRGEPIMTDWPGIASPLVPDERAIQIGERESRDPDFAWPDVNDTAITRIDAFEVLEGGIGKALERTKDVIDGHGLPYWIHLDVDVLDQAVLPAVDSPGSPGIDPDDIATLLRSLLSGGRALGLTLTVFDPDLDPDGRYARLLVEMVAAGTEPLRRN